MVFLEENGALIAKRQGETLCIEPWGENSLRVRATMQTEFTDYAWALTEEIPVVDAKVAVGRDAEGQPCAEIVNGRIRSILRGCCRFTGTAS